MAVQVLLNTIETNQEYSCQQDRDTDQLGFQFCSPRHNTPNRNAIMMEVRRNGEITEIMALG